MSNPFDLNDLDKLYISLPTEIGPDVRIYTAEEYDKIYHNQTYLGESPLDIDVNSQDWKDGFATGKAGLPEDRQRVKDSYSYFDGWLTGDAERNFEETNQEKNSE